MVHTREDLDQLTAGYISDTMSSTHTVQEFCDRHSIWHLQRETELEMIRDIRDRAEKINLTTDHYKKSKTKMKAFWEYMWSKVTQVTAGKRAQKLEKELGCLLQDTLKGLEKLTLFLEAVEKLAVTSLSVFEEENPVCQLPEGVSADAVCSVITAARRACPLLIHFKRDDGKFFMPSLVNVDLLTFQLDKYLRVSQELCEKLQKRLDRNFRMTYLFRGSAQFIGLFSLRCSRMQQYLVALEEEAVKLDRMKMGASISSVVGSSVSLVGGIVSIVGLALVPVTAGASLALTMVGAGLGVTSGVNSMITGITEFSINTYQGKKVKGIFLSYFEDMETMLECLEKVARCIIPNTVPGRLDVLIVVGKFTKSTGGVAFAIESIADCASAKKKLASTSSTTHNIPNKVDDLTNLGQLAKGTPLALSKSARAGFIALNSIFMGVDLFFICKGSISLANGGKSEVSKIIRGRASLWKTELDAWEKIHGSLCIGRLSFERSEEVLQRSFYT
ncbi:uncharacterized protein LOC133115005 [Conger conger]|uniref:uncharacterized protein LOC133115005 n=1 Tax=Conger conger TaxID=82655 RepID=UPI002A5A41AC|nr:uncharacterized protein LOC133115005 [Conger conger]